MACSIRAAVQNARVASCAARLTVYTVPMSGLGPGWVAAATGPAASRDTAITSEKAWATYHC